MTITYENGSGLYVNITNRCSNSCDFCVRSHGESLYGDLWLDREPSVAEIVADIGKRNLGKYTELVFCGFGEPTERLDDMLEVCREVRKQSSIPIRVNTNGHASLIAGEDTAGKFGGLVDVVSVSLNTANAADYVRVCHPEFGEAAYDGLINFAAEVKKYVKKVILSVVRGSIPDADIDTCRKIAERAGVELRVREML